MPKTSVFQPEKRTDETGVPQLKLKKLSLFSFLFSLFRIFAPKSKFSI